MNTEIWRPCLGFGLRYSASNLGRVRRNAYEFFNGGRLTRLPEKIFKAKSCIAGYPVINLRREGESKSQPRFVHHLVLEAFAGKRPTGTECAHKDGITTNAALCNLRWATPVENQADKLLHGTLCRGVTIPTAKLTEGMVRAIRSDTRTQAIIAKEFGIDQSQVSRIRSRVMWKHI